MAKNNNIANDESNLPDNPKDFEVLVIDDELHIRNAIQQLLQLEDFKVRTFSDAQQLLAEISPQWAGIIVSDINMPEMDGLTLLKKSLLIDHDLQFSNLVSLWISANKEMPLPSKGAEVTGLAARGIKTA